MDLQPLEFLKNGIDPQFGATKSGLLNKAFEIAEHAPTQDPHPSVRAPGAYKTVHILARRIKTRNDLI